MALSTAAAKAKGRSLQNKIRDILRKFSNLGEGDIDSQIMGCNGEDIRMSPAAKKLFNGLSIECKNQKTLHLPKWIQQTKDNAKKNQWWLVFRHERTDYVVVELKWLIEQLPKIYQKDI